MDAGDVLKTSTGWNGVQRWQMQSFEVARERVGIEASGGIRTIDQALELIVAGATRLGTSVVLICSASAILEEEQIIKVVGSDLFLIQKTV